MPKIDDIKKVLIIGSGPIVIGQAAEFDYSGTQACRVMKQHGVQVVLVNSNPATIMTDRETADKVYIEPITWQSVEKIIAKERPDSMIAGVGGQTGLNITMELYSRGILGKYGIKVIGTSVEGIIKGEDRDAFRSLMNEIGEPIVDSKVVNTVEGACSAAAEIGYPVVVRPAYTLGGTGGGMADTEKELVEIAKHGLVLSRSTQVLIEKSIKNWKEIEYEVIRDAYGCCITVCNMENVDPVGIHTGDSIVAAPAQTLSLSEHEMLRKASFNIIEAVGIEGGCNVQFALHPVTMEYVVIEINPRVSRSSALASKATGYPIAKVAAMIALGYGLHEIVNSVTQTTFACFEPAIDYIVVKIPKWPFDKFYEADRNLGTRMMATGEVVAFGRSFEQAFLKATRSLEISKNTLIHEPLKNTPLAALRELVIHPNDERIFVLAEMIRRSYRPEKIAQLTGIDFFFIEKIERIVRMEEWLKGRKLSDISYEQMRGLKEMGFSDKGISEILRITADEVETYREALGIVPVYKMIDTCAGEFDAGTPYYYSCYDAQDDVEVSGNKKIVVIGSGPIRIGQGIEFDYSCVQCVFALKQLGYETIVVNNNPETVSTDFDISDKLYFEPLTEEDVFNIVRKEKPEGVVLQFGGQTAIKLAQFCARKNIRIFGTDLKGIDTAEDREKFEALLRKLDVKQPAGRGVFTVDEGINTANEIGYPVLVRPSYVLGGKGMQICYERETLVKYIENTLRDDSDNPILIDKYLLGLELEVDGICDGEHIFIPGIMEHLERAGVHSGDSVSIYPTLHVSKDIQRLICEYTAKIAFETGVRGMINVQFILYHDALYVIEVNPRCSRTVPYISKITGVPIIELATKSMFGPCLKQMGYDMQLYPVKNLVGVKVPIFSTEKLPNVEVSLGPEMRSTGEVLGIEETQDKALFKGFLAAGFDMSKRTRSVLVSLNDEDKAGFLPAAQKMAKAGYTIYATTNTRAFLEENSVKAKLINRISEPEPNILSLIHEGKIDLMINTPSKSSQAQRDGFRMRRAALESGVCVNTSADNAIRLIELLTGDIEEDDLKVYELHEI